VRIRRVQVAITVSIAIPMTGIADSSLPKFDLTVPWPESDRLEGHLWVTVSGMITIAKVHLLNTGSAPFEPANRREISERLPCY
jgi:hypothetical protein